MLFKRFPLSSALHYLYQVLYRHSYCQVLLKRSLCFTTNLVYSTLHEFSVQWFTYWHSEASLLHKFFVFSALHTFNTSSWFTYIFYNALWINSLYSVLYINYLCQVLNMHSMCFMLYIHPLYPTSYIHSLYPGSALTLSKTSPGFYESAVQVFWKHCVFSHNVFYWLGELSAILTKFKVVGCNFFQFGKV